MVGVSNEVLLLCDCGVEENMLEDVKLRASCEPGSREAEKEP